METATASRIDAFPSNDGKDRGVEVFALHLRGTTVHLSSLGATITKFLSKDTIDDGEIVDIVAGYKDAETFRDTGNPHYFNGIVGRVANRIANGTFSLNHKTYAVFPSDPPNSLHGGKAGTSHRIWDAELVRERSAVLFSLASPDGEEGFPGAVTITALYSLRPSFTASGVVLQLDMDAELDTTTEETVPETPINLANHSYFNLGDPRNGILDHTLALESDAYAPVDETSIPTREITPLKEDSIMGFGGAGRALRAALEEYGVARAGLTPEESRKNLEHRDYRSLAAPYGFDHNYVVRQQPGAALPRIGTLAYGPRVLSIYSDAPGVQVYTANHLGNDEETSSEEFCKRAYGPWEAVCLETQHFPDSIRCAKSSNKKHKEFWAGKCPILSKARPRYHQTLVARLEVDPLGAETASAGSDTEGRTYPSIEAMWKSQDLSTWYTRAKDWYEDNCDTTIDGVLGGIGHISDRDLEGSRAFLKKLDLPSGLACECGAGIGRVTKGLLLDFADRCDLVESSSRLLYSAPDHIGDALSGRCRFFCTELQDWTPEVHKYSLIWIQWTLCYLTDADIVGFLKRCARALVDGGRIVLKENTCPDEAFVVDVDDASITRSLEYWLDLIAKSGLRVERLEWQDGFPDDIFPVPMMSLRAE